MDLDQRGVDCPKPGCGKVALAFGAWTHEGFHFTAVCACGRKFTDEDVPRDERTGLPVPPPAVESGFDLQIS